MWLTTSRWNLGQQQELTASDGAGGAFSQFRDAVDDGQHGLAGAPYHTVNGNANQERRIPL